MFLSKDGFFFKAEEEGKKDESKGGADLSKLIQSG